MAGVRYKVELKSIDAYLRSVHGSARELTVAERRVLTAYADRMVDDIANEWPVDTGLSRDSWYSTVSGKAGGIYIAIENPIDYSVWVHRANTPEIPPLWSTLIPEVVRRYSARLIADLRQAINTTEASLRARPGTSVLTLLQQDRRPFLRLGAA